MLLSFVSCDSIYFKNVDYSEVLKEFQRFNPDNTVYMFVNDKLFFNDFSLELDSLLSNENASAYGAIVVDDYVFFADVTDHYIVQFYQCDKKGNGLKALAYKEYPGYKNSDVIPSCRGLGDKIAIYYKDDQNKCVDVFDIRTNTISSYGDIEGEMYRSLLNEYRGTELEASFDKGKQAFVIENKATGEKRIIDEQYLRNSEYYESLTKFQYEHEQCEIINDRAYLVYFIRTFNYLTVFVDGWAYAIFEYDFESDKLIFHSTMYLNDYEGYSIGACE